MITSYAGLKKTLAAYLGWDAGGEVEEFLPDIIRMAELRLQRDMRLRVMERTGYRDTTPGESDVWLPDKRVDGDWDVFLDMREVCLSGNPNVNIEYAAPDIFTDRSRGTGCPAVYTIVGRCLRFAPTPDAAYRILLTYYAEIPPLSDKQSTNEVLLKYPDLYLYGALVESVGFLRSSVPAQEWTALYSSAKTAAQYNDSRARFSKNIAARSPRRRI